jgi:hypothetical protein
LEKYGVGYSGTGARRSGFGGLNDSGEGINITAAGSSGIIGFYSGGMTAGEERMRILANGSVGIGTATPGDSSVTGFGYNYQPALHVNGPGGTALTISGGSYAELDLVHSGGTANAKGMFLRQANQKLEFSSINDDGNYKKQAVLLVDGNTGNIGIGTTGPQTRLDIAGSGLTFRVQNDTDNAEAVVIQAGINAGSTNVTSLGALDLWDSAGAGTAGISFNNINHGTHIADIALNTRGAGVALMVKNSGNVGIGTSNPATTLDVNGSATIRGPLTITSPVNWVASGMNPVNLIVNGGFENWTAGASALPDGWTYYSPAVSVAREGTIKKMGAYSLKVTRAGSDVGIYNEIDQEFGMGYWTGRTVTFSAWVYATVPSAARLSFLGESGASSYHTGDGTWQLLSFTKTVTSTSYVAPLLQVNNNDTAVYFDGVTAVEGSTPFAFSEKPLIAGINAGTAPLSFAGKVGIGTTNPNWSLTDGGGHIALDPSVVENTDKSGNTDFQSSGIGWKAASGPVLGALINTASNGNWGSDLHFSVRNANGGNFPSTSAMVIKSGGNVGIGRTNPATALDVNGTVTAASFSGSGAGLTSLNAVAKTGDTMTGPLNLPANGLTAGGNELVLAGGNVGIGTNNPQSTLHVNGTVTANGIIKALGGLVIENRTSDPASPATGQIWLRTDLP